MEVATVGPHRALTISDFSGKRIWVFPVIGVPTADLLNEVLDRAHFWKCEGVPVVVYDHVGINNVWSEHLKWLNTHIAAVKALKVEEVLWGLAEIEQ